MDSTSLRPHQAAILAAGAAAAAGYMLPLLGLLLLPLQYLNTHVHELGHALAAMATGGRVGAMMVYADGSGVTPVAGGSPLLVASAGYVGAACLGAALIYFGRNEDGARAMLRTLAAVMAIGLLLWLRGDVFGVFSVLAWIGALAFGASMLKGRGLLFAAQFLGIQQCLTSLQAVFSLLQISAFTSSHSDAKLLQDATGLPAVFWAFGWLIASIAVIAITLRASWRVSR